MERVIYISPAGNREVFALGTEKSEGYFTEEEWAAGHPPVIPEISLEDLKSTKVAAVDAKTTALILAGFNYLVNGESYHFNNTLEDQTNMTDRVLEAMMQSGNASYLCVWRGWKDGNPCSIQFTAQEFIAFATYAKSRFKEETLASGWAITERIRNATTAAEVEAIIDDRG